MHVNPDNRLFLWADFCELLAYWCACKHVAKFNGNYDVLPSTAFISKKKKKKNKKEKPLKVVQEQTLKHAWPVKHALMCSASNKERESVSAGSVSLFTWDSTSPSIWRQAERRKDKLKTKDKMAQSNPRCGAPMKRINKLMKEYRVRFYAGNHPGSPCHWRYGGL